MKKYTILFLLGFTLLSKAQVIGLTCPTNTQKVLDTVNYNFSYLEALIDEIYMYTPEGFGAVGDGVTEDSIFLQNMFAAAALNNINVKLGNNKTYLNSEKDPTITADIIIYGNNATIKLAYAGTQDISHYHYGYRCDGTLGTFYETQSDISKGVNFCYINDVNILNNIESGSLLKIISNKIFYSENRKQGEIKKVYKIENDTIVYFSEDFYDTYLAVDTIQVAIVDPINIRLYDLNVVGNSRDFGNGFTIRWAENVVIQNCTFDRNHYAAVYLRDVYNSNVQYNAYNSYQPGAGYGLVTIGGCENIKWYNSDAFNLRHPWTGAGFSDGGINWNITLDNITAKNSLPGMGFATHENVGSVTFNNCNIYHGLNYVTEDDTLYRGQYSVDSTYAEDEIIGYEGMLFQSKIASNTGNVVDTFSYTHWDIYDNALTGFYVNCDNVTINNCNVYGASEGLRIGRPINNLQVNGLINHNGITGIDMQFPTKVSNSTFNNIVLRNDIAKPEKWVLVLTSDTFENVTWGNIIGQKASGIYMSNIYGDAFTISDLQAQNNFLWIGEQPASNPLNVNISNVNCSQQSGNALKTNSNSYVERIKINSLNVTDFTGSMISIGQQCEWLIIGNASVKGGAAPANFISSNYVENLIVNSFVSDTTATNFYFFSGTTPIKKSYVGVAKGYFWNDVLFVGGSSPIIEVLSGNFDAPYLLRCSGTPEGAVSARTGAQALRRDGSTGTVLYIKETGGYGNTGWVAK